jgi:hypothetical protein
MNNVDSEDEIFRAIVNIAAVVIVLAVIALVIATIVHEAA